MAILNDTNLLNLKVLIFDVYYGEAFKDQIQEPTLQMSNVGFGLRYLNLDVCRYLTESLVSGCCYSQ